MKPVTGYCCDELAFWHDPGNYALILKPGGYVEPYNRHIENADPKRRLHNLLATSGLLRQLHTIDARDASDEALLRIHDPAYLERVIALAASGGGEIGVGTAFSANGLQVARRSAGSALAAVDAVMAGTVDRAYALTRPPGHHAEPDRALGFCIFANAAVAAAHAIAQHGLSRVAIVDWDVHFGNGTQACFEQRRDVLNISIHQRAGYLQVSGDAEEIGSGKGTGYSLNVPLHEGGGFGAYRHAFERIVLPALDAYRPELVIVASGYDAGRLDPLGRMLLDGVAYRWMTEAIVDVATRHAGGRIVMVHEGGYCPVSAPFWGLATIETLAGIRTDVQCPFTPMHDKVPGNALQAHQREQIDGLAGYFETARQSHWA